MRRIAGWTLLSMLLLATSAAADAPPAVRERHDLQGRTWSGPISAGNWFELRGVMGDIVVTPAAGPEATIAVDAGEGVELPRIEVITHDQGITICTLYPPESPKKKPNECVPRRDSRILGGPGGNPPPLHFKVGLPAGVHFLGTLARGDVNATTAAGESDLTIRLGAGNVSIIDGGTRDISVTTSVGDVDLQLSPSEYQRRISLDATRGNLRAAVPAEVRASYTLTPGSAVHTRMPLNLSKSGIGDSVTGFQDGSGKGVALHLSLWSVAGVAVGQIELRRK